jgi:hypothetical protein
MLCSRHGMGQVDRLTELVYELLDAHEDTARLAQDMPGDPRWDAHLDYLRRLQRVGREALARTAEQPVQ